MSVEERLHNGFISWVNVHAAEGLIETLAFDPRYLSVRSFVKDFLRLIVECCWPFSFILYEIIRALHLFYILRVFFPFKRADL